jgi:hypothetical protein
MNTQMKFPAKRLILSLVLAASASGCAHVPRSGPYDPYHYGTDPYYFTSAQPHAKPGSDHRFPDTAAGPRFRGV